MCSWSYAYSLCTHIHSSTLNIQTPGMPTLLILMTLVMFGLCDPGTVIELTRSPKLIPTRASVPPSPFIP